jgi:DNA helicase-2/ATP-dependent DNA helicase PcrA
LEQKNIAVSTKRKINIIEDPFGEKILNILRYLALELESPYSGDELLFEIMHYDFFSIPPIEIAKASIRVSEENYNSYKPGQTKTSLRRYISEMKTAKQASLFDAPDQTIAMKYLVSDIDYLLKASVSVTLQQFFQQMVSKMGILKYIMEQPNKGWYMQMLTSIFNFIKDESRKRPDITAAEFVAVLDLMKRNKISLDLNQSIFTQNGVNFMTAHGSKGLEFEHVFLIGCSKKIWDTKGRSSSYAYPDTLTQGSADEAAQKEESRRLFYVALTRAKQFLNVSYAAKDRNGKDQEASQFIGEILAETHLQVQYPKLSEEAMLEFYLTQFSEADKPKVGLLDKNYIDELLQNYTLSVTHLNNYLDCPLKFYFVNLIKVPTGKSAALAFGNAVHWALNRAFRMLKDNNDEFPLTHEFMDQFRWFMRRNRDSFTKEEYKLRMEFGEQILPVYYELNIDVWNKNALTERDIKNVEIDGIPIKGKLDKIEFNGKQINVVDYKTGKYKNAKDKFKRPSAEEPNGGDYWRQAVFYKILIDHDRTNDWDVISTQFEFVEPNADGEYYKEKVVISPQDIADVTAQIKTVHQKIMAHDFSTGCGKKECDWCHFVRSNFTQVADVVEEEDTE